MTGLVVRFCIVLVLGLGIVGCATTARTLPTPQATVNAEYAKAWAAQQTRETERRTPAPTRPRTPTSTKSPQGPYTVMVRGGEVICREIAYEYVSMADLGKVTALQHVANTIILRLNNPSLYVSAHDAENALVECRCVSTRNCEPLGIGATPTPAPQTRNRSTPARTPGAFVWAKDRTPTPSPTEPMPTPTPTPIDYDEDNDGLIEIRTLAQLNAMRWDMLAFGQEVINNKWQPIANVDYWAAFPYAIDGMGCPTANGCSGYELAADLDFDTNGNGYIDEDDDYWNNGAGWESFPSTRHFALKYALSRIDRSAPFEGNGHTIANLYGGSLFSVNYDTISNVALSGVYFVKVDDNGNAVMQDCGPLVCDNKGIITGVTASGKAWGSGGLVGTNSGIISNSTADVVVVGGAIVGGLVGDNSGTISESNAGGTVEGIGYSSGVGGLVGYNGGNITNSTASGEVSGWGQVGGLVGKSNGPISGSTASGDVSVPPECDTDNDCNVGGLVGLNDGYSITDSMASGDVSGHENIGGLVGLQLLGEIIGCEASGAVFGIHDVGGLVGDNRSTIKDSVATGTVSGENQIGGLVGLNNGNISRSEARGAVSGIEYIGGLVGWHLGNTIERSEARGYVDGYSYVGGLVGATAGFIRDSEASGDVKGVEYVGGLAGGVGGDRESVGFEIGGALSDTKASGYVSGAYYVGGLVGWNSGTIKHSTAKGYVSGKYQVDALVGANEGGQISNSTGTGKVSEPR